MMAHTCAQPLQQKNLSSLAILAVIVPAFGKSKPQWKQWVGAVFFISTRLYRGTIKLTIFSRVLGSSTLSPVIETR